MTFYWSALVNIALVPFFSYLTLNNIVNLNYELQVTQGLFKMVLFESLSAVSYSSAIVTMAPSISSKMKPDIGRKL